MKSLKWRQVPLKKLNYIYELICYKLSMIIVTFRLYSYINQLHYLNFCKKSQGYRNTKLPVLIFSKEFSTEVEQKILSVINQDEIW